ncbi:hypothetical protein [Sporosarcina sp. FSL W7-1283]|uniref:hypothetical protein n=1 Tax=Sporosarcina sp. FSL W7-1283 TaxID=2921560 RepID=UPI0030F5C4A6
MSEYKFKGHDWSELAQKWGVEVIAKPPKWAKQLNNEDDSWNLPEEIEVTHLINGMRVKFNIDDEEEVLAEKVKQYIRFNIDYSKAEFKDRQMRADMNNFLKALIEQSKELDYNYPVYEGILSVECDYTFANWFCENLERMWT